MNANNGRQSPRKYTLVLCKKTEMFDYPSGFLSGQKATFPDKGRHGCGANPEGKSLHSWTGMEGIRNGTSRAPSPTVGSDSFRLFSIIPKGYNHAPGRNSCRRQFMVKPIHARQGNSLPIGRSAAPGRVPFEHLKQSTFPRWQSLRLRPEAKPPPFAQGRHGCAANPEGKGTMGLVKEMENEKYPSGGKSGGGYGINETNGERKILPPGESPEGVYF